MKLSSSLLVAAGLLAGFLSPLRAGIERTLEKTFAVQPGGSLRVETQGGEIRVQPSTDSNVKITVRQRFRTNSESEADEILKRLSLALEQQDNAVTAIAKYERPASGFRSFSLPVHVDFIVSVPASFTSDLRTSGGNIVVGDLNGRVQARTSGGDIGLGKMGSDVDASTSGGDMTLVESGAAVKLHTSGGDIAVGRVRGTADLRTSGGDIKIDSVGGALHASTSGGDVFAGIDGAVKGDCELHTSGGDVTAMVNRDAGFQLDASTSGGRVKAEGLTITIGSGGAGKSRLTGKVNAGGPLLKLRSSGGDIQIGTH